MAEPWDIGRVFAALPKEDRRLAKLYIEIVELFYEMSPENRVRILNDLESRHVIRNPKGD